MENSKERVFSIELKARRHLKNISLTNGFFDSVLIEGTLGELVRASFKEEVILEVIGKNGILRIDLTKDEINKSAEQEIIEAETHD